MTVDWFETLNILLFNNIFMTSPMIILTVILAYLTSLPLVLNSKQGFMSQFTTYQLPLAEDNDC